MLSARVGLNARHRARRIALFRIEYPCCLRGRMTSVHPSCVIIGASLKKEAPSFAR